MEKNPNHRGKGECFLMSEIRIEITDYFTILNLHKALLEAKFHLNSDNINVSSSSIIAEFCDKLVDVLEKKDEERSEKMSGSGMIGVC